MLKNKVIKKQRKMIKYKEEYIKIYGMRLHFLKYVLCLYTYGSLNAIKLAHKVCEKKSKFAKVKLQKKYHIIIGKNVTIGKGTIFCHPQNIAIGNDVKIGNNCVIYHNNTIGQRNGRYPKIGNNVTIYPSTNIIGDIQIGDNSIILCSSLVLNNVEPKTMVGGSPAKVIKKIER